MKYLSFDIECADGGKATICSFGYVIADEQFRVLKKEDIVLNPDGKFFARTPEDFYENFEEVEETDINK